MKSTTFNGVAFSLNFFSVLSQRIIFDVVPLDAASNPRPRHTALLLLLLLVVVSYHARRKSGLVSFVRKFDSFRRERLRDFSRGSALALRTLTRIDSLIFPRCEILASRAVESVLVEYQIVPLLNQANRDQMLQTNPRKKTRSRHRGQT